MMAAIKTNETTKLVLKVENGVNANGTPIYSQRAFNKINPAIANDDLLAIGQKIGGLQEHTVGVISRQDNTELIEG